MVSTISVPPDRHGRSTVLVESWSPQMSIVREGQTGYWDHRATPAARRSIAESGSGDRIAFPVIVSRGAGLSGVWFGHVSRYV
jgi:hypothetical protein